MRFELSLARCACLFGPALILTSSIAVSAPNTASVAADSSATPSEEVKASSHEKTAQNDAVDTAATNQDTADKNNDANQDTLDTNGDENSTADELAPDPTGMFFGVRWGMFYRNMQTDTSWQTVYDDKAGYERGRWGATAVVDLGYQFKPHWGVLLTGTWMQDQQVNAIEDVPGSYLIGDYQQLQTGWLALQLRMRLMMESRWYFDARVGAAYVWQRLTVHDQSTTPTKSTSNKNRLRPTAAVGIDYRLSKSVDLQLMYQLVWGQGDLINDLLQNQLRIPAAQSLTVGVSIRFAV